MSTVLNPLTGTLGQTESPSRNVGWITATRKKWLTRAMIAVLAIGGGMVAYRSFWKSSSTPLKNLLLMTIEPRDLPISVIERGNLESQHNVEILCEVEDVRRDGINGTPIVWIVPNGASVEEGDLLVEFDSAPIREELDQQAVATERARTDKIQAEAAYDNQMIQNESSEAEAKLKVDLATLELEMFSDEESGTYKLSLEEVKRSIDDINNQILEAQMTMDLRQNDKQGIESLFKLGYAGKSERDRAVLSYLQAEGQYAAKLNRLKTELATMEKLQTYELQMQRMQLAGKLDTATKGLAQVRRSNSARLEQSQAVMESRAETLRKEEERLARYQEQLEKCKIYAPQDGMIAYVAKANEEIREGAPIRPRQNIMSLPNLRKMQVRTAVHESVLDRIEPNQKVSIRVDAFPDRKYTGTVSSVAVLPDQNGWLGADTKVYQTLVTINEDVKNLKPGMTAVAEIHIDYLPSVTAVPVQSIVQKSGKSWVYIQKNGAVERREIELGRSNDQFVEVCDGLTIGESVVLNPGQLNTHDSKQPDSDANESDSSEISSQLARR